MSEIKTIEHDGIVESVQSDKVNVRILAIAGCASCQLKGVCSSSDLEEKIIEVFNNSKNYKVGEKVRVALKQSLGFRALFLGYVLPFIIVLATLIITTNIFDSEAISGLLSLSILLPYYLGLYLLRNKVQKIFTFSIIK
jgi:sigma-E factor negative regulatory protein RseC